MLASDELQVDTKTPKANYTELTNLMNANDTFCYFDGLGKVHARVVSSTKAYCTVPPSWLD